MNPAGASSPTQPFLVIDDHALLREGVVSVLTHFIQASQIRQAASLQDALGLLKQLPPALTIILDLQLVDSEGLSTLQAIRNAAPRARIAIVSANNDLDLALNCLQEGACAFVPKQGTLIEFQQALAVIAKGGVYFPRELFVSTEVPSQDIALQAQTTLTPRQHEVLNLLLDGLSNAAIADSLRISDETVKLHVRAILRAHQVQNRVQLLLSVAKVAA